MREILDIIWAGSILFYRKCIQLGIADGGHYPDRDCMSPLFGSVDARSPDNRRSQSAPAANVVDAPITAYHGHATLVANLTAVSTASPIAIPTRAPRCLTRSVSTPS